MFALMAVVGWGLFIVKCCNSDKDKRQIRDQRHEIAFLKYVISQSTRLGSLRAEGPVDGPASSGSAARVHPRINSDTDFFNIYHD